MDKIWLNIFIVVMVLILVLLVWLRHLSTKKRNELMEIKRHQDQIKRRNELRAERQAINERIWKAESKSHTRPIVSSPVVRSLDPHTGHITKTGGARILPTDTITTNVDPLLASLILNSDTNTLPQSVKGEGGTFDGGGASADWSSNDSHSSSYDSSSYSSDSSSSSDSGSSSSGSD